MIFSDPPPKRIRLKVESPVPGQDFGAKVSDIDTGLELHCVSATVSIDSDDMEPILTLTVRDFEATFAGVGSQAWPDRISASDKRK